MAGTPEPADPAGPGDPALSPGPAGPPNALVVPRYAGPDTFARLPRLTDVGTANVAYELLGLLARQAGSA